MNTLIWQFWRIAYFHVSAPPEQWTVAASWSAQSACSAGKLCCWFIWWQMTFISKLFVAFLYSKFGSGPRTDYNWSMQSCRLRYLYLIFIAHPNLLSGATGGHAEDPSAAARQRGCQRVGEQFVGRAHCRHSDTRRRRHCHPQHFHRRTAGNGCRRLAGSLVSSIVS